MDVDESASFMCRNLVRIGVACSSYASWWSCIGKIGSYDVCDFKLLLLRVGFYPTLRYRTLLRARTIVTKEFSKVPNCREGCPRCDDDFVVRV